MPKVTHKAGRRDPSPRVSPGRCLPPPGLLSTWYPTGPNAGHPDHLPAYLRRALFQDSSGLVHLILSARTRPGTELAL